MITSLWALHNLKNSILIRLCPEGTYGGLFESGQMLKVR